MISSGPPQVFVPFGREHYARHPGNTQPPAYNCSCPKISFNTDAGEDILDAIKDFSINEAKHKTHESPLDEDWILRAGDSSEEELYYKNNTVIWSKGRCNLTKHVIKSFTIDHPVHKAFWCHFPLSEIHESCGNNVLSVEESFHGIGIVSSSKINVLTTDGQEYIAKLPFQVNSAWTMKYGVLLERKLSISTNSAQRDTLPVVFSLLHPLNEVTPVVQRSIIGKIGFLGDQYQQIVYVFEEPSIVITYDSKLKIHTVWKLRLTRKTEEFHTIKNYGQFSSNTNQQVSNTPGCSIIPSRIVSPIQRSCSPHRYSNSRISSPGIKSRSQSPTLTNLTHMAAISRSQSPSAVGSNLYSLSRSSTPSGSRIEAATPSISIQQSMTDKDLENSLRKPLASEICLESIWVEPKLSVAKDGNLSNKASKVFITTDFFNQQYFCYLIPNYSQLRLIKVENFNDTLSFGLGSSISAKDAEALKNSSLMVIVDIFGKLFIYSGLTKICKIRIPFGVNASFANFNINRQSALNLSSTNIVTSSRPSSALGMPFTEEVQLLSPVPSDFNESSMVCPEDTSLCTLTSYATAVRDAVDNRISVEMTDGNFYRVAIPIMSTSYIVDQTLASLCYVIPKDILTQLYSKWYMTSHATGSVDTTPLQYWNSFAMILTGMMGYNVGSLHLLFNLESESSFLNESIVKKFKSSDSGCNEDWEFLLKSEYHRSRSTYINLTEDDAESNQSDGDFINSEAVLFAHLPAIHFVLHLLYEELKLCNLMIAILPHMARLLYRFSCDLRYENYSDYYWRDFPEVYKYMDYGVKLRDADMEHLIFPSFLTVDSPSIYDYLENIIFDKSQAPFLYLPKVNERIKTIVTLYGILVQRDFSKEVAWDKYLKPITHDVSIVVEKDLKFSELNCPWYEAVVTAMFNIGIKLCDLSIMPSAIVLPLYEAINKCRKSPPSDWPVEAYILIGREDLASQINYTKNRNVISNNDQKMPIIPETKKPIIQREDDDGMEHIINDTRRLHFSQDMKLQEVQRLLQSSKPARITITQRSESNDNEFLEEQERYLFSVCIRTMAVLVGRGMFTLRTSKPVVTEMLHIPNLCLTGRVPSRNTTIDLSHIDVPEKMNMWPLFHNGVAAGLRLAHNASDIDSTWIVYNKPKGIVDVPVEHAGFLMSMGLNGHLKNLDALNIFNYAAKSNDMTSVGLILGISAAKRGTMDMATTKLLSIHVEALLPPSSTELDIPHIVQVAAVMGIGLVYQGSAHRHMAEVLLSEIGRPPGPEMENSSDCESYSVAAGLALGLIMLGKGSSVAGLSDLCMADLLYHYMIGGPKRQMLSFARERYKLPSYQIKEGDAINVDVTSPGATLALGLLFFGTNDSTIAQWMIAPDTQHLLNFVRPDFLLLRTLSKGLIMWDSILPSPEWVESHVPKIFSSSPLMRETRDSNLDMETLSQTYCNIIAGACMALGLRFAGSANKAAYDTLLKYARTFIGLSGKATSEQAGRTTVETCINVVVLSLATVMAGTGELEILRLCRHLHARIGPAHCQVLYGSHMATHMAIGLLFLGGGRYTLNNSKESIAALVCAFFPKFPTHSNDNRYHLQALRHLYALAVEPRLLIPEDIETGQPCYNHVSIAFKPTKWYDETTLSLKVPNLLPQLDLLSEVRVDDPRYWPVSFRFDKNWNVLKSRLEKDGAIYVKRRTGCLSYAEDPNGFKSLLAQSLVKDKSGKWRAKPLSIEALTSDPMVLNIISRFLNKLSHSSAKEAADQNVLTNIVYECVTQEKLDVSPFLAAIMKIGVTKLSSIDIREIRFSSAYLESKYAVGQELLDKETFHAICDQIDNRIEHNLKECNGCFMKYLKGEVKEIPDVFVSFLIRYSLPLASKLKKYLIVDKPISLPALLLCFEDLSMSITTVIKIHELLT